MGIRFSKQIRLGSLLKLNVSKSGVSLSAGRIGASINLGKNGTYVNLSPSLVGISGTGLSYRQKISGGYGSALKRITANGTRKTFKSTVKEETIDTTVIDEYNNSLNERLNLQKECIDVLSKEEFDARIIEFEVEASKQVYQMYIDGDEDIVESAIGAFLNSLDLGFEVGANFELEDHDLYLDLDLPEIEDFNADYPVLVKGEIVTKKKTAATLKEEYAKTILGLSIYLTSNFFNVSSYIDKVIISAFTSKRNSIGDLEDEYLYSIKYTRDIFENTNFTEVEDSYKFLLQFDNRINMQSNYSFKEIKPYEQESIIKNNSLIDDAVSALKEFGYKTSDIEKILPELNKLNLTSSSEYLKAALKLLSGK